MIDVIIATDNEDGELGAYFRMCATDLYNTLVSDDYGQNYRVTPLYSDDLTSANILSITGGVNHNNFVFINFSHGSVSSLGKNCSEGIFIDVATGVEHFIRSLFYTFSCSAGAVLGPQLVRDGCHTFWGYEDVAQVIIDYDIAFMECSNYGFKMLLSGNNVQDSYDLMKNKFDETIDYFEAEVGFFATSIFNSNKDSLVLWGNNTLMLSDWCL